MNRYINGKQTEAAEFFFDGCHKIYLADTVESYRDMFACGWDRNDVHPIEELPEVWTRTCPLRFISSADLTTRYVEQCEPAEFEGWALPYSLRKELDEMRDEQLEANGEER